MRSRRVALLVSLTAALVVAGAALAWACTTQAYVTIQPQQGQAGSEVTVDGRRFTRDVEIRWNGEQGPLLGTAEGGSFQKKVTVPTNASDGHYSIVAVGYDEDGEVAGRSSASFTVTSSSSSGRSGNGDGQPEGNEQTGSQQTTAGQGQSDSSGDGQSSTESNESTNNSTDQQSTSDSSNDQQSTSGASNGQQSTGDSSSDQQATNESSDEFAQASNRDGQATRESSQDQESTSERSSDGDAATDGDQQRSRQADAGQQAEAGTDQQPSSSPNQPASDPTSQGSSSDQPPTADQPSGDAPTTGQSAGDSEPDEVAEPSTEGRGGARRPSDASPFGPLQPAALHDASMLQRVGAPTDRTAGAASGDLWSGLDSSSAPTTGLGDGPGAAQQPHSADQQLLAVGAGAVATGLMLLAGGALLVALRRRSVLATRDPRA